MGKPRGGEKADADKTGSGGKRAMISRRCWSRANMTPADVTPFKAACHPPRGCCGRRIAQQTGCPAPGWDWFTGQTYCTVGPGERTGACVSAPLTLCAHWTGLSPQGTPAAKNCITHTSTWKGIVYVSGIISHFLWENQFRTVNKILSFVSCSVQGLDFDLMLQLLFLTLFLWRDTGFSLWQVQYAFILPKGKINSFTSGRGESSASLFQLPRQAKKLLYWFCCCCCCCCCYIVVAHVACT